MPRLFTGISLPQQIKHRLHQLCQGLPNARWVDESDLHLTLRFIGDVEPSDAEEIAAALSQIKQDSFQLILEGLGVFGGRKPRTIWADVRTSEPLNTLQLAHENLIAGLGFPPEQRKFVPHITLARLKSGTKPDRVARYLETNGFFGDLSFDVDSFALFSAKPGRGGGPYVVEQEFPLGPHG